MKKKKKTKKKKKQTNKQTIKQLNKQNHRMTYLKNRRSLIILIVISKAFLTGITEPATDELGFNFYVFVIGSTLIPRV